MLKEENAGKKKGKDYLYLVLYLVPKDPEEEKKDPQGRQ